MDQLHILAEIAIALAGFSSIIVVFRRGREQGEWKPEDVFRLKLMLQYGLVAAAFALLPGPLVELGFALSDIWRALSALLALYILINLAFQARTMPTLPPRALNRLLASVVISGNMLITVALILNAGGWVFWDSFGVYLTGVSWLAITAGMMFYRLIMAPIKPD